MKIIDRIRERIGRRVWIRRIDTALLRAYEAGLIDSWTLHEIDARAKGYRDPRSPYPSHPRRRSATREES